MSTEAVRMTQTIHAPAAEAYRAFARSVAVREWLSDGGAAANFSDVGRWRRPR